MRRKKGDKRVLRSGNGHNTNSRRKNRNPRKVFSRNKRNNIPKPPRNPHNRRKKRKNSGRVVLIMIVALIAFVIGAGIGVTLVLDNNNDADEGPHFENVTNEMTVNLADVEYTYYDKEADGIDYNENTTFQLDSQYISSSK